MKKYIIIIILSFFLVITVFLCFKNKDNFDSLKKSHLFILEEKKEHLNFVKKMYQNNIIITKENEHLELDKNIKLLTLNKDTISLEKAITKNSLVFCYSILNCGDCVNSEFENLQKHAKEFSKDILVIAYSEKLRSIIYDYKKLGLENVRFLMLTENKLGIPMDKHNNPYYFHIDKNLTVTNVLLPMKDTPKLSEYYLKHSFNNYFK